MSLRGEDMTEIRDRWEEEAVESGRRRYYVTTAIDYPNAAPHIGHALEKVAADVVARYHRLRGDDTYFSMGIDENSLHVLTAANAHDMEPHAWIDQLDREFRLAWRKLNISYDYWMRTTEERHTRASQEMFRRAVEKGDIYKGTYSGWYCPNCNTFYTADELIGGHCPNHPSISPEWLHEENYFFALSKYSERLLEHFERYPDFITPVSRKAEVVALARQGLRDFSVSRFLRPGMQQWGIPVPGDAQQVMYVWFDALTNYITAVGFPDDGEKFARYWPADTHLIGKDITRFHCLYWPAMLMSADLPLPEQVAVHGFVTIDGKRPSKTLGNGIDPVLLIDRLNAEQEGRDNVGVDMVRYYLMRNLSFGSDGDFSRKGLMRAYQDELGNDLGNLLNRVVSMIKRYRQGQVPQKSAENWGDADLRQASQEARMRSAEALERWEIGNALGVTWSFVRHINQYIEQNEPWKLAKQAGMEEKLDRVLYSAAEATRIAAILLSPYIPQSADMIMEQLGLGSIRSGSWERDIEWGHETFGQVVPGGLLFPRFDADIVGKI